MATIDRSQCAARRHGTMSAYQRYGCRCPDARNEHRLYAKRRREGRPYRRLIDATGSRRRIQALFAIGHTGHAIADLAGINPRQIQLVASMGTGQFVTQVTAARIATAYDQLSTIPGPSAITRRRAAAKGWLPPHWWIDDIDDPDTDPLAEPDPRYVDEELVGRVLAGVVRHQALNAAERTAAVVVGQRRGLSVSKLADLLGTKTTTVRELAAQAA